MTSFSVNVQFDPTGVQQFQASGMSVAIAQEAVGGQPVVWVAFQPLVSNTISWEEQYAIYVSAGLLVSGSILQVLAQTSATAGNTYAFNNGGFQAQPGPSGAFGILNQDPSIPQLAGGLSLPAQVNGAGAGGPFTAAEARVNAPVTLKPESTVQLFGAQGIRAGQFMPQLPPTALTVDLSSNPAQTVHWDDDQQRFAAGPL